MATEYTLLYDIDDGKTYGTDGTAATGSSLPTMAFRDQLQINLQLVRDGENYTGLSSYPSVGVSAAVDNEWTHYSEAELEGSGYTAGTAITTLTLSGVSTTPALVENIALINSSAQSETVAYTGYAETATAGTYNFTVSHTLTYSYADGAEARLGEPLIMKTATGDTTGKNTGMIKFILDGDNSNFQTAIEGQQSLSGAYCQAYIVDGSGNVLLTPTFPVNLIGRLDNDAAVPPPLVPNYSWSKAESDARYLLLVDLDESTYDATGFLIAQDATGGTTKLPQTAFDSTALSAQYRSALAEPNLIVNGAMEVSQEKGTTAVTGGYPVDNLIVAQSQAGVLQAQQDGDIATVRIPGFGHHVCFTALSTPTVGESDYFEAGMKVEGKDIARLKWGTADARPLTVGIRIRPTAAGNIGVTVANSAQNRSYPTVINIAAGEVNTPVTKYITIPGDTSGTWLTAEGSVGLSIWFVFAAGSNLQAAPDAWTTAWKVANTVGNFMVSGTKVYITGIDLYADDYGIDRPFPHKTYPEYLAECQRYYQKLGFSATSGAILIQDGNVPSGNAVAGCLSFSEMCAAPNATLVGTWGTINAATPYVYATSKTTVTLLAIASTTGLANYSTNSADDGIILEKRL